MDIFGDITSKIYPLIKDKDGDYLIPTDTYFNLEVLKFTLEYGHLAETVDYFIGKFGFEAILEIQPSTILQTCKFVTEKEFEQCLAQLTQPQVA